MNDVEYKGDVTSFWELLNNHKIEIPIIQRDYAQGRKDKKEIQLAKNKIKDLDECPTCYQSVKQEYKDRIFEEQNNRIIEFRKEMCMEVEEKAHRLEKIGHKNY